MSFLRVTGLLAWAIGIAGFIGVTVWSGAALAAQAFASVGWGIALVVMVRVLTILAAGVGWWPLFPAKMTPRLGTCVLLRFLREAANTMLPLGQVGGDFIGARLLTFFGVPGPLCAASIIVDLLMQAATQFLFAVLGLALLLALGVDPTLASIVAVGLAAAVPVLTAFYLAQRRGGQRILRFVFARLAGDRKWQVLGTVDAAYRYLTMIYADRVRLAASLVIHSSGWVVGAGEVFIALTCMGQHVTIAEALIIESLMHAIRGAAFAIPGALGAQEGGLVVLCAIFGVPAEQALALSLVKRVADLALGLPGLIGWQALEAAHLRSNQAAGPDKPQL